MSQIILEYYETLKNKVSFDIVTHSLFEEQYKNRVSENSKIFILPSRKKKTLKYISRLRTIIKQESYDIIHIHGNSALMSIELKAIRKFTNAKIIVHCHGSQSNYGKLERLLRSYFYKNYDKAITVELDESYLFKGKPHEKILNGINLKNYEFQEINKDIIANEFDIKNHTVLLHVGRFNEGKNHKFLIKVFQEYLLIERTAKLFLVGDGPLKNDLIAEVKKLGLSKAIVFVGEYSQVEKWYSASDVFLFPSLHEAFGLVAIEAQANGLPCVFSTSVPRQVKVNENVEFCGISDEDVKEWLTQIHKFSKLRKNKLTSKINPEINKYDIKSSSNRLLNIYHELIYDKG